MTAYIKILGSQCHYLMYFVLLILLLHSRNSCLCPEMMSSNNIPSVDKNGYQAVGFPCNRMLKLSSSRGIRIDVPVLSVACSFVDHSVIIQALRKGLIGHEGSDTRGVPRWKSSCPDRLTEATSSYISYISGLACFVVFSYQVLLTFH